MFILVINCGSSSAKYELFGFEKKMSLARGVVERIGSSRASLLHFTDGRYVSRKIACRNHHAAIGIIIDALTHKKHGIIARAEEIKGIGHRVVHGGEEFKSSVLITPAVIRSMEKYSELAPLHNPPALAGVRACRAILKEVPQVAVFDTAFHHTMPANAFLYGLPFSYYKKYAIRKYGFHGTSHRFVAQEAARVLKRPFKKLKLITCHLGNGCSMTAVDRGISVDTSMGFTPLEGLLMGTRSGNLDPAVLLYILEKEKMPLGRMNDLLNKESGLLGVSGISNDMRDILKAFERKGKKASRAGLAIEMFTYRIKKYIGAYQAVMNGLDAVVFTAGIGENAPWLVKTIRRQLNKVVPKSAQFLVIRTNEELMIAKDTYEIVKHRF